MIDFLWLKNNNIITWILDIQIFRRLLYDGKSSLQVIDLSTQGGWLSAVSSIKPRADEHNIIRSIFLLCSAAHLVVENQMMVTCMSLDKYQSKKFERLDPKVQNPSRLFDLKESWYQMKADDLRIQCMSELLRKFHYFYFKNDVKKVL